MITKLKFLSSPSNTSIGLDIGTNSIKFVKLKKKGRSYKLLSYGIVPALQTKDKTPEKEPFEISSILNKLLKNEKDTTPIFTSISGPEVIIRSFNLAHLSRNNFGKTVFWASKRYVPIPMEETNFDYKVIGEIEERNIQKKKVMIVAATKRLINDQLEVFRKAGLKVERITAVPFAYWNLMKFAKPSALNYALIDIGASFTTIAIFQNNNLNFTRAIITSGNSITESVSYLDSLSFKEAEELKKGCGLLDGISRKKIVNAIKPVVERLINEIERTFSYYRQKGPEYSIEKIYLTGGTAMLPGLLQFLKERMGMDVELINPFEKIELSSSAKDPSELSELAPLFSEAIGLALETGEGIDLLPPEIKQKKVMARLKPFFMLSAFSIILILSVLYLNVTSQYKNNLKLLGFWKSTTENISQSLLSPQQVKAKVDQFTRMKETIEGLEKKEITDLSLIKEISNILPESIVVENLSIDFPEKPDIKESDLSKIATEERRSIDKQVPPENMPFKLQGIVFGEEIDLEVDLLKFLTILNSSPFFRDPSILSQGRSVLNEKTVLQFTISCDLK